MAQQDIQVTTDIVVQKEERVLLIRRRNDPFKDKWALPGGFIDHNEKVVTAAMRELHEETGLEVKEDAVRFINYFDAPGRDPRGRIISFAFGVLVTGNEEVKAGDDAGEVEWFSVHDLPELAFDHKAILAEWLDQ